MSKTKLLLTILSVAIFVVPLTIQVIAYQDNLLGLVFPPELANLTNGNSNAINSQFKPPELVGQPEYNPNTQTATFTFRFTNPLNTEMNVGRLEAGIKCHDHGILLGNASIGDGLKLAPKETVQIIASGRLSDEAVNHFRTQHAYDDDVNIDFVNLNVEVGGVKIQVVEQNIGWISIQQFFGDA
jgi:hypothetical protein